MIDRENGLWLHSLRIPPLGEGAKTCVSSFLCDLLTILLPTEEEGLPSNATAPDDVLEPLHQVEKMIHFLQIPGDFHFSPIRALDDPSQSGDYAIGQEHLNMLLSSVRQWLTPSAELVAALEADLDKREQECENMLRDLEDLVSKNDNSQATIKQLQSFLKQTPEGNSDRVCVEKILTVFFNPEEDSLKDKQRMLTVRRRLDGDL
jgi:hypothetical protein